MTDEEKIVEALIFIELNLEENINAPLIAKEVGLPIKSFLKLFRQMTGLGTERYIRKRRLTEVYKHLSSGESRDDIRLLQRYRLCTNFLFIFVLSKLSKDIKETLLTYFLIQESLVKYIIEKDVDKEYM